MAKIETIKPAIKIALGSILVLFFWWASITGYSIGDPLDPLMLFWGIVLVFGAILGPVVGVLIWPFLVKEVFVYFRKSKSHKE